ncbi:hypothetical protein FAGAP_4145 [Fusarium agapanthi]|uniref:Uncharacterized protein n=1 Tax=Fusarium agapanthi TaxID=1803897 RepID=A0A9P5BCV3_9HYPO|nr:hypothetical protein FAGAP_4145 [Fusarium agapanthi]
MTTQFVPAGWPIDPRSQRFIYDEATKNIINLEQEQATAKRLQNNKLQGYDEVVAISEETLNTTLRLRYSHVLKKKKDLRLREFNHVIPRFGVMKAKITAPHLQLVVDKNGGQSVLFFVNFQSGTFEWWRGSDPSNFEKFVQKVDGWSVALEVNFNKKDLARPPSPVYKQISTMTPGSYSVSQILLTLSNASVASINMEASNFPNTPDLNRKRDMYDLVIADFKRYFDQYLQWLKRGPYSVLGYTIQLNKTADSQLPRELQPTDVFLRTQIYTPCTEAFKNQFPNTKRPVRGGLDALMFLQMTGNKSPPEERYYDDRLPTNWVTGKVDCSLTMSKSVFWDSYLVDKFSVFNLQALSIANDIWWWIRSNDRSLNRPWQLTSKERPTTARWSPTADGASYVWREPVVKELPDREFESWTTLVGNNMEWKPGTDEIDIFMYIHSMRRIEHSRGFYHNSLELRWRLKLRLNTIKDGKLEAIITSDSPQVKSQQIHADSKSWFISDNDRRELESKTEEAVKAALAKRELTKDLSEILNDKSKFVFPGAGEFAMREPKFNAQGDLQLDLTLKSEDIIVDDTFHLIVNAKGSEPHEKWLKLETREENTWRAVLVKDQAEGTEFQISDGNLVMDIKGLPEGPRAGISNISSESRQRLMVFNSEEEYEDFEKEQDDAKKRQKCEFSVTGSEVLFSRDNGKTWHRRFYLKGDMVGFTFGDPHPYYDDEDVKLFMLDAIY